jgi:hypothetical protein
MSTEFFDWRTIEEDIAVPEQAAIAVYCNPEGKIVLRQAGRYGPDEDTTIVVHPSHALALVGGILDRAGLEMEIVPLTALRIQNGPGEVVQPFPDQQIIIAARKAGREAEAAETQKDRTAAERQRRRRERQRERDSVTNAVTHRDADRDTVTSAPPPIPELELDGGQNKALAH